MTNLLSILNLIPAVILTACPPLLIAGLWLACGLLGSHAGQ
tara:strand:- start:691 stop:813 length:123 start_codon:yes stop_codon:yes gene_type:complete